MECVDLRQRFGKRHRVDYEETYFAERTRRTGKDPWLMILLCKNRHLSKEFFHYA